MPESLKLEFWETFPNLGLSSPSRNPRLEPAVCQQTDRVTNPIRCLTPRNDQLISRVGRDTNYPDHSCFGLVGPPPTTSPYTKNTFGFRDEMSYDG